MRPIAETFAVSLVQFDAKPLAIEENLENMRALALDQVRAGARMIVFPELSNTGYVEPLAPAAGFSDTLFEQDYAQRLYVASEPAGGAFTRMLGEIAVEHGVLIVAGLATRHPILNGVLHNSSLLLDPSGACVAYHKIHRWHMEKLYFMAGGRIDVHATAIGRIGMQVCYDIRFPELTRSMALRGAEIITNIWASFRPVATPPADPDTFIHRAYTRAIENGVFFLSCNRAGRQGDFQFLGRSCLLAPDGRVLARSTTEQPEVLQAEIDLAEVSRYRSHVGLYTDRRPDLYGDLRALE